MVPSTWSTVWNTPAYDSISRRPITCTEPGAQTRDLSLRSTSVHMLSSNSSFSQGAGFGRRAEMDFVRSAVETAKAMQPRTRILRVAVLRKLPPSIVTPPQDQQVAAGDRAGASQDLGQLSLAVAGNARDSHDLAAAYREPHVAQPFGATLVTMPHAFQRQHDAPAARLDGLTADDPVERPVSSLDQNIRLESSDERSGVRLRKNDHIIHAA